MGVKRKRNAFFLGFMTPLATYALNALFIPCLLFLFLLRFARGKTKRLLLPSSFFLPWGAVRRRKESQFSLLFPCLVGRRQVLEPPPSPSLFFSYSVVNFSPFPFSLLASFSFFPVTLKREQEPDFSFPFSFFFPCPSYKVSCKHAKQWL